MMNYFRHHRKYSILIFRLILTISMFFGEAQAQLVSASSGLPRQQPYIYAFLYPPYAGVTGENSILDHHTPENATALRDGLIVAFTGDEARGDPIADDGVYLSNDLGYALSYDQHEGIDFDLNYEPVFAAADSDEIIAAGWANPGDHTAGLGLNVGLLHANGYRTYYGHFSSIAVVTCPVVQCVPVERGDVIGISGNTGHSGGPHLHFEVRNPIADPDGRFMTRVDPYGWTGTGVDPAEDDWRINPNDSLWVDYPEISSTDSLLYATSEGDPLTYPLFPGSSNSTLIDDYGNILAANNGQLPPGSSPNFTADACWTVPNEDPLTSIDPAYYAINQYKLLALTNAAECAARWSLPTDQPSGTYAIYIHLPGTNNNPVANSVPYRIYAEGEEVAKVLVNQGQIESYLESQASSLDFTTNAAWLYVGSYYFVQGEDNYIRVSNIPEETIQPGGIVLADAVKFLSVGSGNVDTVLIVDSSGSMTSNDPQNKRLQASRTYVSNASVQEDYVGVVDFDSIGRILTNPQLQKLHDNDASVIAAINTIPSNGSSTNIGAGLQSGCNVLTTSNRMNYRKGAILLTDGIGTLAGQDQCFKNQGWPIFTFGFGSANDAQLQQIAFNSGGRYKRVDNLTSLTCEFIRVRALIADMEPPPCLPFHVPSLSSVSFTQTVAPAQEQAIFSTSWPGSDVVMTLTSPSGRVIDRNTVASDVTHQNGATYEIYTISNPEPGNWSVNLYGANVPASGEDVTFGFTSVPAPEAPPTACTPSNTYGSSRNGGAKFASLTASNSITFDRLPLSFVPNRGQEDQSVRFQAQGLGGNLFFTPNEVVFALPNPEKVKTDDKEKIRYDRHPANVVRIHYQGANDNPEVAALEELPGVVNILKGNDPAKWQTNLPAYSGIAYRELYPGIELRYEGPDGNLKSTFYVAAGANPASIVWRYKGASDLNVDASGNLAISLPEPAGTGAKLMEQAPIAWQGVGENRVMVAVKYAINKKDKKVSFLFPNGYDSTLPLVIDPTLTYSTYLGGGKTDEGHGITLDADCNIYIVGDTSSTNFPTVTPIQPNQPSKDIFVSKLNPAGTTLLYSTYIGGNASDEAWDIALDSQGRITIAGETESSDFPSPNAYDNAFGGGTCEDAEPCDDVIVTQLTADGAAFRYSTYVGGNQEDDAYALAIGSNDQIYVTGITKSSTFPTPNGYDTSFGGGTCTGYPCEDAFVAKINPALSGTASLLYSTFLGGGGYDRGKSIALDTSGRVYVGGYTRSSNYPTLNAYQTARAGDSDVFLAKLDTTLSGTASLLYSTYFGGSQSDHLYGLAVKGANQVYFTGYTQSTNLPLANAFDNTFGGGTCGTSPCYDVYVTHLDIASNSLVYSSFLGGSHEEQGAGITVDDSGNAYVTGYTKSTDFNTLAAIQPAKAADSCSTPPCADAFVTKVNASGALVYATYLGGTAEDYGNGIVVDGLGNTYIVGHTFSSNFPGAINPFTGTAGYADAFVVKIDD